MDCSVLLFFRHLYSAEARIVLHTAVPELPIDMGNVSALLINIGFLPVVFA